MPVTPKNGELFLGGTADDTLYGDGASHRGPNGSGPDDRLYGGNGADVMLGDFAAYDSPSGGGNDTMDGQRGDDILFGGGGRDILSGGSGDDILFGGFGQDTLFGSAGNDRLVGGPGADLLIGGLTRTAPWGRDVADYATSGRRVIVDLAVGRGYDGDAEGDKLLHIQDLRGSEFADILTGSAFANRIEGGGGGDLLDPGIPLGGHDTLVGGAGGDVFRIHLPLGEEAGAGDTWVIVTDFSTAEGDRLAVQAGGPTPYPEVGVTWAEQRGADVHVFHAVQTADVTGTGEPWVDEGTPQLLCILENAVLANFTGDWLFRWT